jgi:exopolysaccharide biosynthesis polyprenyl glycosylphosphotransferase
LISDMPDTQAFGGTMDMEPTITAPAPTIRVVDEAFSPAWELPSEGLRAAQHPWHRTSQARDALFRRSLAFADIVAAYGAILIATLLVGTPSAHLRASGILIAPLIVIVCKAVGLYDRDEHLLRKTTLDEVPSILHIAVFYALAVWLTQVVVLTGSLDRAKVFTLVLATFVLMSCGRMLARCLALRWSPEERCIVLGGAADAERAARKLDGALGVKAAVVSWITISPSERDEDSEVDTLADLPMIVRLITETQADRVIIAPDGNDEEEILQIIRALKAIDVKVSVLPRLLEVVGSSSSFDEIDGITLLGVHQSGLTQSSRVLKRGLDIVVSSAALLLMAPIFIVITAAILIDSRGRVLFRQTRIGCGGQRFTMYKFRSMVSQAEALKPGLRDRNEADGLFKMAADPRITRVGRLLRTTSLDELPQLLNVLRGHMSLVGPRPLVPDEDVLIAGWERRRLAVKPGMTGLWQIYGSSRIPLREMAKIDFFYYANWSVWTDVKILLRTVPYVVKRRGM